MRFIFFLLMLLHTTAYSQIYVLDKKYKNHLEAANMQGKVKRVKAINYQSATYENDSVKNAKVNWYLITDYNSFGNIIEKKSFRSDHSLSHTEQYFYNDKQQLIKLLSNMGTDASSLQTTIFKYDAAGNKLEETSTMFNGTTTITQKTFKHDGKRRVVEMVIYYPTRKETDKRIYRYDSRGILVEQMLTGNRIIYEYPSTDKTITYILSSSKTDTVVSEETFDKYRNVISTVHEKGKKPDYVYVYDFDKQENWVRMFVESEKGKVLGEMRVVEYY